MRRGSRNGLGVFLKEPRPGTVKTRLGKDLGMGEAARLYRSFVADTLETAGRVAGLDITVFFSPDRSRDAVEAFLGDILPGSLVERLEFVPQGEGDLGDRMARAFEHMTGRLAKSLLIGTDLPDT